MKFIVKADDFIKLLQYTDSICVRLSGDILSAQSKIKGLETLVAFPIVAQESLTDFFSVTFAKPVSYFKAVTSDITIDVGENMMSVSDGVVSVELPIVRDIIADYDIPPYDKEKITTVSNHTRINLRSMLSTMAEVSKALADYSGVRVYVKNGIATYMNFSMLLECSVDLPDMCVSSTSLLNMLTITNQADKLSVIEDERHVLFITNEIVIRIAKENEVDSVTAATLMQMNAGTIETTKVSMSGLADRLHALSAFRDSNTASLTYNENEMGISMRGNGYSIISKVQGHAVFINPRVLIVLGRFLNSNEYLIERGEKHVCLSTQNRKLVICATSF